MPSGVLFTKVGLRRCAPDFWGRGQGGVGISWSSTDAVKVHPLEMDAQKVSHMEGLNRIDTTHCLQSNLSILTKHHLPRSHVPLSFLLVLTAGNGIAMMLKRALHTGMMNSAH